MKHRLLILFLAWMMAYWPGDAVAKDTVKIGDRIRIWAPELNRTLDPEFLGVERISPFAVKQMLFGTLTGFDGKILILRMSEGELQVPVDAAKRVEVWSRGHRGFTLGFLGAVGGAVVGGLIGNSMERKGPADCPGQLICDLEFKAMQGVVIGGLSGGVLGALIGSTLPRDSWKEVSVRSMRASVVLDGDVNVGLVYSTGF